MFALIGVC